MQRSIITAVAAALLLAACGGGGGGSTGMGYTPPSSGGGTTSTPASMPMQGTVLGTAAFVSSSNQHTLYTFGADTANTSNCTASSGCTAIWPPYTAPAGTTAPAGSSFGIMTRSDGTLQWTYSNLPLYTYTGDTAAGSGNGQGINSFGAVWGVARPAGTTGGNPGSCVGYSC